MTDSLRLYMAPMEGLTGYIFRNAYQKYFHDMDTYFTPFLASTGLNHKEWNDIIPEHNQNITVIPQILTNRAADFLAIAAKLGELGYSCVNLNLGCPSGTVVAKKRGAGFLAYPEALNNFLDEIFLKSPVQISVKTRIGLEDPKEWESLADVFASYPMKEMIIHPRVQKDQYRNHPNWEVFEQAVEQMPFPVCYNGDIHTEADFKIFQERFPNQKTIMLGRGVLKDPGLPGVLKGGQKASMELRKAFHDELLAGYQSIMSGDTNTLYKMKEFWVYFGQGFPQADNYLKKIKKVRCISDYRILVEQLFRE